MEKSSTWTALQEIEYKCRACDTTIRGTKNDKVYCFWCPKCGSVTVVEANNDEAAYADAVGKNTIYR